jgi:hypothetical protein
MSSLLIEWTSWFAAAPEPLALLTLGVLLLTIGSSRRRAPERKTKPKIQHRTAPSAAGLAAR